MLAPASKAALLKNPPGAHLGSIAERNPASVQEKSVPTFFLQGLCSKIRQGGESVAAAYGKIATRKQGLPVKMFRA